MTDWKLGQEEYAQLRSAAKTSVNAALTKFGAHGCLWMDDDEMDDIVSDAITKALATFVEGAGRTFRSWVKLLAYQTTVDRLNAHRQTVGITWETEDGDEVEIEELGDPTTPEEVVIGWESERAVDECISRRSELDGHIFNLHTIGYQPREIAVRLGVTPNIISVHLDRMKKAVTASVAA